MADPTEMHQVVMNLCLNAAHAMEENGGTMTVTLDEVVISSDFIDKPLEIKPGNYVQFTVEDTGHGIKYDIMNKIYDPFFTTKPVDKGTGMGLSVVHGIITDLKGFITFDSNPGKGTTFDVYLPIYDNKPGAEIV